VASSQHPSLRVAVREWALVSGPLGHVRFSPGSDFAGFFLTMSGAHFAGLQKWLQVGQDSPIAALSALRSEQTPLLITGRGVETWDDLTQAVCTLDGRDLASRLALEARTLEWLALFWQQAPQTQRRNHQAAIPSRDRQALEKVARILRNEAAAEHSLADLSRRVHLNEFKLKRGFRLLWGTTVFSYLREQRLQCAEALLRDPDNSVIEVANAVGYSNPSHFARAFNQRFGRLPKAYQSMHARSIAVSESA